MEDPIHPLCELFKQLGLPGEKAAIESFIAHHGPLPDGMLLSKAPFWTPPQAQFLGEAVREDADWAPVVDQLDVLLRKRG